MHDASFVRSTIVYLLHVKGALVLSVGLSVASRTHTIRTERSAAWQLLESLPDQLVKLLRLRGERLHLVLSELRLKRQNLLESRKRCSVHRVTGA